MPEVSSIPDQERKPLREVVRRGFRLIYYALIGVSFYECLVVGNFWYITAKVDVGAIIVRIIIPFTLAMIVRTGEHFVFTLPARRKLQQVSNN